jgi:putative membrane protein
MTGEWHADVLAGLIGLACLYVWAARVRRQPLPCGRALAAAAGLLVLAGALNGPLHDLSDRYLFSAHMVQHLMITLVAPPLLLVALVPGMLAPALRWPPVRRALGWLTRLPVAFVLYSGALVVWHLPGPYNAALERHGLHIVQHLSLMTAAVLAWWPILSPEEGVPRAAYPAQLLYLFLLGLPMTAVAAFVTFADDPLYPFYAAAPRITALSPLEDQRLGGVIMWVPAGLIPLMVFTRVFFRWVAAERDEVL